MERKEERKAGSKKNLDQRETTENTASSVAKKRRKKQHTSLPVVPLQAVDTTDLEYGSGDGRHYPSITDTSSSWTFTDSSGNPIQLLAHRSDVAALGGEHLPLLNWNNIAAALSLEQRQRAQSGSWRFHERKDIRNQMRNDSEASGQLDMDDCEQQRSARRWQLQRDENQSQYLTNCLNILSGRSLQHTDLTQSFSSNGRQIDPYNSCIYDRDGDEIIDLTERDDEEDVDKSDFLEYKTYKSKIEAKRKSELAGKKGRLVHDFESSHRKKRRRNR
jgi:hypothetical protein